MKVRSRFDAVVEEIADSAPSWKVRFWSKVNKHGPKQPHMRTRCHVWTGATSDFGHGVFWLAGRVRRASHVAFFLKHGRWPKPCALHKCDVPGCVRLGHLFEGSKQDNTDDMIRKGRDRKALGEEASSAKLTIEQVLQIQHELGSSRAVGAKFGVSHVVIQAIRRGESWRHV